MRVQTTKINNRRYLGNKYKLLPFITKIITENCGDFDSFTDIFAGTGTVASAYTDKKITTNDILFSNYISNTAWFSPENFDRDKLISFITIYNSLDIIEENYMTKNFSDTYFSRDVCSKIGFIREDIEEKKNAKIINNREYAILLTSSLFIVGASSLDSILKHLFSGFRFFSAANIRISKTWSDKSTFFLHAS